MKNLFPIFLLIVYSFSNAQEGSYVVRSFHSNSKDTSTFMIDVKDDKAVIHCNNKLSHQPILLLLSFQKKEITIIANEQGSTAITFGIQDYISAVSRLYNNQLPSINLEKIEKQNSIYNYRYKSKELQVDAKLDTCQQSILLYLQLLKLNPLLFGLQLPEDRQCIDSLKIVENTVETNIQVNFTERKIASTVFEIPDSATKIKLDKSRIPEKEYHDFIQNMNNNF